MKENKKELNLGREAFKGGAAMCAGWGAGTIVGVVAMSVVKAATEVSKPVKALMYIGAFGLQLAATYGVEEATKRYCDDVFEVGDMIKGLFKKKDKTVNEPVNETALAEVK